MEGIKSGKFAMVQVAYNILNAGYMEATLRLAYENNIGIVNMKSAVGLQSHHKELLPLPTWRIDKLNAIVPGDMKPALKAYLWSLHNPHISAVVSNIMDETMVEENLALAGQKI
ncbi:hypothetical protein ACFLSA_05235 [Bacteroidota bacterium]